MTFSAWLISLSLIPCRSIHVANSKIPFSFFVWLYPTVCMCCVLSHFSHVQLFATLWTVACQAPLSLGFPRQEHWSGLPFPSPDDLSYPRPLHWQVDSLPGKPRIFPTQGSNPCLPIAGRFFTVWATREAPIYHIFFFYTSIDGRLDCFCILASVNNGAMNIGMHKSFLIIVSVFFV